VAALRNPEPKSGALSSVSEVEWQQWKPEQRATLLFVIRDEEILLIHKKRGLGAGNINGPGGRIEPGETPLSAAIREVEEELLITPSGVEQCGELYFQFLDGLSIHCTVFRATGYTGEPTETDEAIPIWADCNDIPYDRMWEDDQYWMPLMLRGTHFKGYFIFDGSKMIDHGLDLTRGGVKA